MTWRLAHMNLAIHTIEANLGTQAADTFLRDLHPDLKADYILANPPFNVSDWSGHLLENDVRGRFGKPPNGNAIYAWLQHFIHHVACPNGRDGGVASFVMANGEHSPGNAGLRSNQRHRLHCLRLLQPSIVSPQRCNNAPNTSMRDSGQSAFTAGTVEPQGSMLLRGSFSTAHTLKTFRSWRPASHATTAILSTRSTLLH